MAKKKVSIESRVADTILQNGIHIKIGDREHVAPAPTLGTLFLVADSIAGLPNLNDSGKKAEVLSSAKYAPQIAAIVATFILGAKTLKIGTNKRIYRFLSFGKHTHNKQIEALTNEILEECTPAEIGSILLGFLDNSLNDFFAVTTFLREANPAKPTREVVKKRTTALGL